jgi:ATP-binding cassette subfamily B protein
VTDVASGDHAAIHDAGDLDAAEQAMLTELLGAPSQKGALKRGFKVLPRILPYLRPYRAMALLSVLLTILLAVVALAEPWPLAFVVDSIIGDKPAPGWVTGIFGSSTGALIALAVGATLFLTALSGGMTVLNEYLSTTVDQRMVLDFRSDMFEHAQKLSLAFHDTESKGILMYRINNQASAMGQIVVALPVVAQNVLTVVGMAYISFKINPLLALLALGTTPFVVYSTTYYTDRIEPRLYRVRGLGAINLAIVYEAMSMIRVVLAFGTQRHEYRRFRQQGEQFVNETVGLTVRQTAFKLAVQLITAGGTAAVIGVGAYQAVQGTISAGQLLVVLSYIAAIYQPLEELTNTITLFQQQFIGLLMSFDLMDMKPDVTEKPDARPLDRARGEIELEGVSFGYEERRDVLKDINFRIPPGQAVAVVGPTGAGKSTLVSLLPRFYEAREGVVRIDGHDVRDLKLADLRSQFSIVLQEPLLFSATIQNNIRYGSPDASDEEVIEAAKAANAHDFITELPDGYTTLLGERGAKISGGERQRIAVARSFLRNAPILILDEPTSSIDSRTESVILEALDRLMEGRTTIMIAHRLSTLRSVGEILVMNEGEIVQRGSHQELAAVDGLYKELWDAQTRARDGRAPPPSAAAPAAAAVEAAADLAPDPTVTRVAEVERAWADSSRESEVAVVQRASGHARVPQLSAGARRSEGPAALPKPKIVLLGMLTKIPVGGVAWLVRHYAAGFERLGYEVYYVEAHSRTPSMFMNHQSDDGVGKAVAYIGRLAERFGLEGRWAFQALHQKGHCYGMSAGELDRLYRDAALIINMHGGTLPLPEHAATDRLVFLGTDPVDVELEVERGDQKALEFLDHHMAYFTWGLNYGNPDCRLPWASPYPFIPSPPPVVLDFWENEGPPDGAPFTTIGNWRQEDRNVSFQGQVYRWSKHQQFMKILDLPTRTQARIELALSQYDDRDRLLLAEHGWRVRPGYELTRDLDSYRDYILRSAAEVSAAKEQNVHFRTGWFSERSTNYLAAGRPVILQDTGFGGALPTGEGLFAFADLDQAADAVDAVQSDPARHQRSAREIAHEYLSHEVVLGDMLDHVGLAHRPARRTPSASPASVDLPGWLALEPTSQRLREETVDYIRSRPVPAAPPPAGPPDASVVVRVGADVGRARLALEAVLANTTGRPYEVIVVDAVSDDATREYAEVLAARNRHVRVIGHHGEALAAARGDILALLDDGTIVAPDWLEGLAEHLEDPTVGLVSPVSNGSRGGAQVAYGTYGELLQLVHGRREELRGQATEVEAADLSCVASRRDLLDEVGPLAEHGFASIETIEDDYARRVRAVGRRVVRAEDVFAHRFGGPALGIVEGHPHVPVREVAARETASRVVDLAEVAVAAIDEVWSRHPPSWMARAGQDNGHGVAGDQDARADESSSTARTAVSVAATRAEDAVTSSGGHPRLAVVEAPPEAHTSEPTAPPEDAGVEAPPPLAPPPAAEPAAGDGEVPAQIRTKAVDGGEARPRRASPATLLFIAAACVSAGLLIYLTSKQSFMLDEWSFILDRRGFSADVLFDPHNEHIVVIPVAIYKLLLAVFGLSSAIPFHVMAIAIFIATVTVVFVALRRLVGEWLALACVLPLFVFGSASEGLLLTFQFSFSLSLCFGLAALVALQSERLRHRDAVACLLLVLSILSVSLGLAFALGVGAWLLVTPGGRRRLWIPLVPLAIYGLWWLGWGHDADSTVTLHNIAASPSYILDGLAGSLTSLLGLTAGGNKLDPAHLDWGRPLLVGAAAFAGWQAWRLRTDPEAAWARRLLVGVCALAFAFWALAAFNAAGSLRPATAPRYELAGAVFLLLIAAVICGRRRLSPTAWAIVFAVSLIAAATNLYLLHSRWEGLVDISDSQRAALTALELERDRVPPDFQVRSADTGIPFAEIVRAGPYFDASHAYGSPAYSLSELAAAPENAREAADRTVASALGVAPVPGRERTSVCWTVKLEGTPVTGNLPPRGATFWVKPGSSGTLALGRLSSGYPVNIGELPSGTSVLRVPKDAAGQWRFQLGGGGPIQICALRR